MDSEPTGVSSGALVFANRLIFESIVRSLEPVDMLQLSVTCRLGWKYATLGLWTTPLLMYINNFQGFVEGIEKKLPFEYNGNERYGDIVRAINLSTLGGRWERVGKYHIEQIFKFCPQLRYLDINLCQHISDEHMSGIFSRHPTTCQSLRYLDISETMFQDATIANMLGCTKNLTTLVMNETEIGVQTVKTVARFLTELKRLEISDCFSIDGHDINEIARSCTSITYLSFDEDLEDDAEEAIKIIKARGGSVRGDYDETVDVQDGEEGDYGEYDEFDDYDEFEDYDDFEEYDGFEGYEGYYGNNIYHHLHGLIDPRSDLDVDDDGFEDEDSDDVDDHN